MSALYTFRLACPLTKNQGLSRGAHITLGAPQLRTAACFFKISCAGTTKTRSIQKSRLLTLNFKTFNPKYHSNRYASKQVTKPSILKTFRPASPTLSLQVSHCEDIRCSPFFLWYILSDTILYFSYGYTHASESTLNHPVSFWAAVFELVTASLSSSSTITQKGPKNWKVECLKA